MVYLCGPRRLEIRTLNHTLTHKGIEANPTLTHKGIRTLNHTLTHKGIEGNKG